MPKPGCCAWGGRCEELNGFGKFGSFCEAHAAVLAEIASRRTAKPRPPEPEAKCDIRGCDVRANDPATKPLRCWAHRAVSADRPVCAVESCTRLAARTKNSRFENCQLHRTEQVAAECEARKQAKAAALAAKQLCAVPDCDKFASSKTPTGQTCWLRHRATTADELALPVAA